MYKQYLNLNMSTIIFIWISTVHDDVLVHSISKLIVQYARQLVTHVNIASHISDKSHTVSIYNI